MMTCIENRNISTGQENTLWCDGVPFLNPGYFHGAGIYYVVMVTPYCFFINVIGLD
jgi:hypothetical protein